MPAPLPARGAFGTKLRAAREEAGASQDSLADASGVPQPQISRLETGKAEPTVGEVVALEVALGLHRGELLIAAGFVDVAMTTREAIERDPMLPPEIRLVLLGAYDAALAGYRRRQGAADDVDEGE